MLGIKEDLFSGGWQLCYFKVGWNIGERQPPNPQISQSD
jgi:hypothetical protein